MNRDYISSNQKAVLNIFMDPRNKHHIFAMRDRKQNHHHVGLQHVVVRSEFDFEPMVHLENPNYLDEPYIYHARLLEVLYNCTIGKEGMLQNETRLRSIISLKYALEVLTAPDKFLKQGYENEEDHEDEE